MPSVDRVFRYPCSKSAMNRVGEALRDDHMTPEDEEKLRAFIEVHLEVGEAARARLEALGLTGVARAKARGTLRDKLVMLHDQDLARIDDPAGVRIIVNGDRDEQNRVVKRVVKEFTVPGKTPPRVKDRRKDPSQGYRAVHVLAVVDDCRVEIQVRTILQHAWAEVVEDIGDLWGRELRYGLPLRDPDASALMSEPMTRRELVDVLMRFSTVIDEHERLVLEAARGKRDLRVVVAAARGRRLALARLMITNGARIYRSYANLNKNEKALQVSEATMIDILSSVFGDIDRSGRS